MRIGVPAIGFIFGPKDPAIESVQLNTQTVVAKRSAVDPRHAEIREGSCVMTAFMVPSYTSTGPTSLCRWYCEGNAFDLMIRNEEVRDAIY
jgi:hypothetical protein